MEQSLFLNELTRLVEERRGDLKALSEKVWSNPEIGYTEHVACKTQVDLLAKWGFTAKTPAFSLDTAFIAEYGEGKPVFAIASEYDALPEIGHGCGHNLICTASLAAFVALRDYMKANSIKGRIVLLGTPAEESGGGKIVMLDNGCLDGIDAVMMLHPTWRTTPDTGSTANRRLDVEFIGKAAHAAGSPELGRNALDAVNLLFAGVNAYRQQMPEFTRIHGIVLEGGKAPNIIPGHCSCRFFLRSSQEDWEDMIEARFRDIVQGAALMTATTPKITSYSHPYKSRKPNAPMNAEYFKNAAEIGLNPVLPNKPGRGSSDFGDFSQKIPGIHAYFAISDHEIPGHSTDMAHAAASMFGFDNALKGAAAMATVALKYLTDDVFRAQVAADFAKPQGN